MKQTHGEYPTYKKHWNGKVTMIMMSPALTNVIDLKAPFDNVAIIQMTFCSNVLQPDISKELQLSMSRLITETCPWYGSVQIQYILIYMEIEMCATLSWSHFQGSTYLIAWWPGASEAVSWASRFKPNFFLNSV